MVSTLTSAAIPRSGGDPLALLKSKKGDAFACSSLYCALLRAVGVPARMVAGYLVGDAGQPHMRHFWDEFYIETLGWVPVDPLLARREAARPASVSRPERLRSAAYYFGNLDNQHVTLTKGLEAVNQMDPQGKTQLASGAAVPAQIHEEAVGG